MKCASDIQKTVEECRVNGSTSEIMTCTTSVMASVSDCIVCICEIVGTFTNKDTANCVKTLEGEDEIEIQIGDNFPSQMILIVRSI